MFTDKQTFIFAVTFVITYWIIFRIATGKLGYVWITRKQYEETGEYISLIVRQNEEYKKLMATSNHFPTVAKPQKLFDTKTVKPASGQMYTITDKDGTWGMLVSDYNRMQTGDHLYERSTCTKHNGKWGNVENSLVWLSDPSQAYLEEYVGNKTAIVDREIKLDNIKKSTCPLWIKLDGKNSAPMMYNAAQIELIK